VEAHAVRGHGRGQRARELGVEEGQQHVAPVDEMHLAAQRRERAGVLAADHAAADHRQPARQRVQLEDLVGIVHPVVPERELGRMQRGGTGGDQDALAAQAGLAPVGARDRDRVRVDEATRPLEPDHGVFREPRLEALALQGGHPLLVPHEVGHGRLAPQGEIHAVQPARAPAGQHQRGLAQRLARNGAGVDAGASEQRGAFDQGRPLAEQAGGVRTAGAGGTAAQHDEIEPQDRGCTHVDRVRGRERFVEPRARPVLSRT
jgi:hypothetical protein